MVESALGRRIREARKRKDLTLETVGRRAGVAFSYVSDLEHGRLKGINRDVLKKIVTRGLGERWEDWEGFVESYLFENQVDVFLRAAPDLSEESKRAIRLFVKAAREEDRRATEEKRKKERKPEQGS